MIIFDGQDFFDGRLLRVPDPETKKCSGSNQSDSLFEAYLELVKSNLSNLLGSKTISRIQLNSDLILIVFFKDICK